MVYNGYSANDNFPRKWDITPSAHKKAVCNYYSISEITRILVSLYNEQVPDCYKICLSTGSVVDYGIFGQFKGP